MALIPPLDASVMRSFNNKYVFVFRSSVATSVLHLDFVENPLVLLNCIGNDRGLQNSLTANGRQTFLFAGGTWNGRSWSGPIGAGRASHKFLAFRLPIEIHSQHRKCRQVLGIAARHRALFPHCRLDLVARNPSIRSLCYQLLNVQLADELHSVGIGSDRFPEIVWIAENRDTLALAH